MEGGTRKKNSEQGTDGGDTQGRGGCGLIGDVKFAKGVHWD